MRSIIRLGFIALSASVIFTSCKKDHEFVNYLPPAPTTPSITSKIYPFTNEPAEMALGTAQSTFAASDILTLYVPYGIYLDKVVSSKITFADASTGEVIAELPLSKNTDPGAAQLSVPSVLRDVPFMFVRFTLDESFEGRNINVSTSIKGEAVHTSDTLTNAFSVEL